MIRSAAPSGNTFPARSIDRSQENPLGVAIWKSLVIEPELRHTKHGDQEANHRPEQSRSAPEPLDLDGQLGIIRGSEIARDDIGSAAMNPASNGRARDVQFWEEKAKPSSVAVSGFADCFLDSIVVGPSRVEGFHLDRIGRCMRDAGADRKCPMLSRRCSCNAYSPECSETQQCAAPEGCGFSISVRRESIELFPFRS